MAVVRSQQHKLVRQPPDSSPGYRYQKKVTPSPGSGASLQDLSCQAVFFRSSATRSAPLSEAALWAVACGAALHEKPAARKAVNLCEAPREGDGFSSALCLWLRRSVPNLRTGGANASTRARPTAPALASPRRAPPRQRSPSRLASTGVTRAEGARGAALHSRGSLRPRCCRGGACGRRMSCRSLSILGR